MKMKKKKAITKAAKKKERTFSTLQEMTSHFFPEGENRDAQVKGDKRGAEVAERAFTEISQSIRA